MTKYLVSFPGSPFVPQELSAGAKLSEVLTVENSPILFGCRTGICGTCLITLETGVGDEMPSPDVAEREVLDMIADHEPKARLACQIKVTCPMSIAPLDESL
jgi:ferredoxin